MQTTVTSKGQVTIPKAVRDLLGLHAGSKVSFRCTRDGRVELVPQEEGPAKSRFAKFRGHAGAGMDTDAIMALTRDSPAEPDA
ncbi:AbrB/MazE/SpoVT family DNA-binding domain-containing protein (plasmid) [Sulfitobacter sp. W027]|uniref:AbrB/MazE/SpoVT family DNA-binding domain-containing protein n=1 Tax=Sulfitobacter sp. W027 TaxID=2867025 RepID=UPI0021A45A0E|nr:AbrB/MazE/SpoVT family DNA-binding domain-containing protein [Sulfitobacter sp. W027]UWR35697.1 AbrB/MazE/SpoVT family DNA-binding domain-containing protein [Sulfitobacter sp. W027]